ncbi:ATP synthase F1 subunit gamma [Romboutsia timonensis]|uniref:ATP synthase F1 subunit gamma n=1 Tax=Romboutsia timonensis TaxID=1776391 RepID=UPI0023F9D5AD|nr:ATP synthase F1 subunit gamma [Romboutsia timonensis]MDU7535841.1 ATP synthase F1 subunit gamma [Peptostreptococcaceae bacterium]MDY2883027.1 ATP synthase F1 subunit gamma [Romboutsia timonensis]MDY3000643.1 ATP synthase F1 subunit gamma [Romboutsia timonensis]MDY3960857.1 ATP synthase F1 subunit gamma [Romboutsia timonensis]
MAGAGMKEIKTRIKSVESTKQITKAMELVSSSKFRKAKERAESARPYFNTLYNTVQDIAKNTSNSRNVFLKERKVNNVCYIVIAGDRGLAGGYNSNILKAVIAHNKLGTGKVITVGKKAKESLSKRGYEVIDYIESVEKCVYEDANRVAQTAMEAYKNGEVDEVNLVYTEFISALSQEPKIVKLLPVTIDNTNTEKEVKKGKAAVQYLPSADAVLGYVLPKYVSGSVYGAIAESFASEQAARRTAMESATDNANEMISKLELVYNRARQAAVTQEISEIVGGAAAAK